MECRPGCAACCVVITISSPVPGFPDGKPAGVACKALTPEKTCTLWGSDEYPEVCRNFRATEEYCGNTDDDAYERLAHLETETAILL